MHQASLATRDALYRLALLAYGDAELAERAAWDALSSRSPARGDISELAPALLGHRARRWRYRPVSNLIDRSGLSAEESEVLLDALASLSSVQRLALGLSALRSLPWPEAALLAGQGRRPADPRPQLGLLLGLSAAADDELPPACRRCAEAIQRGGEDIGAGARRHLLACERCQATRESWRKLNELLRTALPALFVTPPEVLRRFAGPPPQRDESRRWRLPALLATLGLAVVFFVLHGSGEAQQGPAVPASESLTAQQVLERSIDRFSRPPRSGPIVHEVIEYPAPRHFSHNAPFTLERWYDYGPPARLRLELSRGEQTLFALSANGQGQIQMLARKGLLEERATRLDRRLTMIMSSEQEQQYLPLWRQLSGLSFRRNTLPIEMFRALQTARANPDKLLPLGSTTALERPAWLLSAAGEGRDYLLTVDQETYALVDVQVVDNEQQQDGRHPWRVKLLEVLDATQDDRFTLGSASWGERVEGRPLPPNLVIASSKLSDIQKLDAPLSSPLLLPATDRVPANLGQIVWFPGDSNRSMVTLWSEYGLVFLSQFIQPGSIASDVEWEHTEAGLRFTIADARRRLRPGDLSAVVDVSPLVRSQGDGLHILHINMRYLLSTPEEREALLRAIIASLAPADEQQLKSYDLFRLLR